MSWTEAELNELNEISPFQIKLEKLKGTLSVNRYNRMIWTLQKNVNDLH